jgi:Protein of unknown function (DUF3606)
MADNLKDKGPADRTRVNVHESWEVTWWTKQWNVTEAQLKAAVAKVGVMAHNVAAHLGKPKP